MPAKSKQQQKLMGTALSMKRGEQPCKGEAGELAEKLPEEKLEEMASLEKTEDKSYPNPDAITDAREWWFGKDLKLGLGGVLDPDFDGAVWWEHFK